MKTSPSAEYDYVIVGAGSAGCALAHRLSESGRHRVLLLEAGGSDRRLRIQVPIGYGITFYDRRVNWMYLTEPVPGLAGQQSYWPRGRVLGGSSSINAMVYVRGQPQDYDAWAALGNPGWGWADVGPVFRRMEDTESGDDATRGRGGRVHVHDVAREVHPLCDAYLRAAAETGLALNPDCNGVSQEGAGLYRITVRDGVRMSAARAYLWPARRRPNLHVLTGALALRVLFRGRRAVGVEYRCRGRRRVAACAGEVILSAGAVNSPQLLQLSGVGPAGVLKPLGIDVVLHSPAVGEHLQDHLCFDFIYRSRRPTLNEELRPWHGKLRAGLRYALRRSGPLALSLNQAGGFIRTRSGLDRPNMQLYFSPVSYTRAPPGVRPLMSPDPFPGFLMSISPCRPESRGRLWITSADASRPPLIQPNYLSSRRDVGEMLEGVRFLRRLAQAPALAEVIESELRPGAALQSDDELIEEIRRRSGSVFHPVGTCRMGPDPATAVVDHRLRVHGLEGLRVIDASVFPLLTSGNTNAPAMMVGERGADLVLGV